MLTVCFGLGNKNHSVSVSGKHFLTLSPEGRGTLISLLILVGPVDKSGILVWCPPTPEGKYQAVQSSPHVGQAEYSLLVY